MASAAVFSSLRRRRTPSLEPLLAPVQISEVSLLGTLSTMLADLVSKFAGNKTPRFQRKNFRNLIRKIEVFAVLLDCLMDSSSGISIKLTSTQSLCFKELYLVLYRSKILVDYCLQSSKLWLLLQNKTISGHFHDLNQEISTLLDVFPLDDWNLPSDVIEQVKLLKSQSRKSRFFVDRNDEMLRLKLYSFLNEFERGYIPEHINLYSAFVQELGITDVKISRIEIENLEEQIVNHDGDIEPTASVLTGLVALTRYCRFSLFGFDEDEVEMKMIKNNKQNKGLISRDIAETYITIPKDFCCPISLDLMKDPVIISTGQTYERSSIARWIDDGHNTCPKTGQLLDHTNLVPNRALRNLIIKWSIAHGISYDSHDYVDSSCESNASVSLSKAAIQANKATAGILIGQLANGTHNGKTIAAREIRFLAKNGTENRAYIAESGAIPYLKRLLLCSDPVAQENSVTAMLNLSIYDKNKCRIMDEEGCLGSIVNVLKFGCTTDARENAAATLFSLSAIHNYKKRIAEENGAIEALSKLLKEGTARGQKDAVTALFNLSTHTEIYGKMIESGAIKALVWALGCEVVAEEAAGALALIVRQSIGAEAVGKEETGVTGLIRMMRCGTPKGKENAVAALLALCRNGGEIVAKRVVKTPALAGLLQMLVFTGTKRARRKAASLARVFQRFENGLLLHYGVGYGYSGNSMESREISFGSSEYAMSMHISVPVL